MIYSLNGKIMEKGLDRVVIECGGVGYEVRVPLSAASALPAQGGADHPLYLFKYHGKRHLAVRLSHGGGPADVPAAHQRLRRGAESGARHPVGAAL